MNKEQDISLALQKIYPQKEYSFNLNKNTSGNVTIVNWDGGKENLTKPTVSELNTAFLLAKDEKDLKEKKEQAKKIIFDKYDVEDQTLLLLKYIYEIEINGSLSEKTKNELTTMFEFIKGIKQELQTNGKNADFTYFLNSNINASGK